MNRVIVMYEMIIRKRLFRYEIRKLKTEDMSDFTI
jgi:hypothetical protein